MKLQPDERGFSLIELMIVIVIVGILAGIAMPSYSAYLEKTRRTDARTALLEIASVQERVFFERSQYSDAMSDVWNLQDGDDYVSAESYYVLTVAIGDDDNGAEFTATATARGQQSDDVDCETLSIDETGRKAATAGSGGDSSICW